MLQYDRLALNVFDQLLTRVQKCTDEQLPLEREALEHGRTESLGAVQGICSIESARRECGTGKRLRIKQCALYAQGTREDRIDFNGGFECEALIFARGHRLNSNRTQQHGRAVSFFVFVPRGGSDRQICSGEAGALSESVG